VPDLQVTMESLKRVWCVGMLKLSVKKTRFLGEIIFLLYQKNRSLSSFIKPIDLSTVSLILVRKSFNYFNFYSIEKENIYVELNLFDTKQTN
jgi:hypothetical protein